MVGHYGTTYAIEFFYSRPVPGGAFTYGSSEATGRSSNCGVAPRRDRVAQVPKAHLVERSLFVEQVEHPPHLVAVARRQIEPSQRRFHPPSLVVSADRLGATGNRETCCDGRRQPSRTGRPERRLHQPFFQAFTTLATSSRNRTQAGTWAKGPPSGRFSASCRRNPANPAMNLFLRRAPRGPPALSNTSRNRCFGSARPSRSAGGGKSSGTVTRGRPATLRIAGSSTRSHASIIRAGTIPTQSPR